MDPRQEADRLEAEARQAARYSAQAAELSRSRRWAFTLAWLGWPWGDSLHFPEGVSSRRRWRLWLSHLRRRLLG